MISICDSAARGLQWILAAVRAGITFLVHELCAAAVGKQQVELFNTVVNLANSKRMLVKHVLLNNDALFDCDCMIVVSLEQ